MIFLLLAAIAAEPTESPPAGWTPLEPAPAVQPLMIDDTPEEVLVVGEQIVADRRAAVVRQFEAIGWKALRVRDGTVILRGPEAWMGKARLAPTGDLSFTQPAIAADGPREPLGVYESDHIFDNDQQAGTVGIQLSSPAPRKVRAVQEEVRAQVEPAVIAWREAIQRRAFGRYMEELPDRLDKLWDEGLGLDGASLPTLGARRAALLEFWATRTDTPEGRVVTRTVEGFLRSVVQLSAEPVTPEERAAAEQRRVDQRPLDLGDAPAP